jgi:hypothetical protein
MHVLYLITKYHCLQINPINPRKRQYFTIPKKTETLFEKANTGTENKNSSLDVSEI